MIISDKTIIELNKQGLLFKNLLNNNQIQPNSVDLTLADTYKIIEPNACDNNTVPFIDISIPIQYTSIFNDKDSFLLPSRGFILAACNEVLNIPNGIVGIVCGRSSIARVGLVTEQAGFVDAGFKGTITFELFNQTNHAIKIFRNMRIGQIYFLKAEESTKLYGKHIGSKYSGQVDATESRIHLDFNQNNMSIQQEQIK